MKKFSAVIVGAILTVGLIPAHASADIPLKLPRIASISAHMAYMEMCNPTFAPQDCTAKVHPSKVSVRLIDMPKGAIVKFQHKEKGKWTKIKQVKVTSDKKAQVYRKINAPIGKHRVVVLANGDRLVSDTVTVLGAR